LAGGLAEVKTPGFRARPVVALTVLIYLLHQDVWFWRTAEPVIFAVFPIGLGYHVGYVLVTTALLVYLVRRHWPGHLDHEDAG
jgi:hypothetical protein